MRKCDFCRLIHTKRSRHAYWFSAVIQFLVGLIIPLMQKHSLRLKELISQAPEDAMLKIRLFKPNRVLLADKKSDVNQTCEQSVFSPIGACIRICCTAGAVERRSQMFVYRLSPFPFPLLAIFSPFPRTESLFTGYVESWLKSQGLHKDI